MTFNHSLPCQNLKKFQVVDPQSEGYEQDSFVANDSEVEFDSRLDTLDLLEGHQNLTELRVKQSW